MKINKDLVDAVMMVAFIALVLVITYDFADQSLKNGLSIGLSILTVVMVTLRVLAARNSSGEEKQHH